MSNLAKLEQSPQGTNITTPSHLLAMAVQQGADLDKLEKLMALQERWEASEARKAFTAAMTGFRAEPVEIYKLKNVSFKTTSYNHAELSDVTEAINPALAKHDLSFRWDVQQEGNSITVACVLTHIAGHSERITMTAPPDDSGGKNKIQQIASTVTYLQRYTLLAITGMSTKGQDNDGRDYGRDGGGDHVDDRRPEQQQGETPEQLARRKAVHDAAAARHSESVTFIKDRIAAEDWQAAADEWGAISQDDQMALWLATSKGGIFTTAERKAIKERLPKPQTQQTEEPQQ